MHKFLLCLIAIVAGYSTALAQELSADAKASPRSAEAVTDSVGTQLEEVVVEGRTQRVIKNGVEYIPGKNMKKTALDAYRLLYNMQIPKLVVSPIDNSVTSPTGQDVTIYIDYIKATPEDLSGLRPENVMRVEVLDYPEDPRFEGNLRVVNFIMKHYEWGGYTKLTAFGWTLNGEYIQGSVYNKFVTGRWTIDAFAQGSGEWNDKYRANRTDIFRDFDYDDIHIDEMTRTENVDNYYERDNGQQASLRFSYQGDKQYISHTAGFSRSAMPYRNSDMSVDFTRGLLSSSQATDNRSTQNINATVAGHYRFFMPKGNTLFVTWVYGHSGNKLHMLYDIDGQAPIVNGNKEKAHSPQLTLNYTKRFQHNNSVTILLSSHNSFYDTDYSGSYRGKEKMVSSENLCLAQYTQNWAFGLSLFARAGASYTLGRLNGENLIHQWNPRFGLQFQYRPNDKNMFGLEGWMYNSYPNPSMANGALVRSNELLWNQGNPDLKSVLGRSCEASYTFIPRNNFSLSASVNYEIGINRPYYDYVSVPGIDGLVRTYGFDNREKQLKALITASLRLFNNSLGLYVQGGVQRQVNSGSHAMNKTSLIGMAYVNYFIGNFSATVYCAAPDKTIYGTAGRYFRGIPGHGLNLAYSLKSFDFGFDVVNIFSNGHSHFSYGSRLFSSEGWNWSNGFAKSLRLSVTYTLPYGKQVNRNNELQDATQNRSAILER